MTRLVARYAARRAHVLTVEAPGYWVVRAEAERRLRARGWCAAISPADADVLAVCGTPGPELAHAVNRVWDQLPGPRVLVELPDPELVESALDRALEELGDVDKHRSDARERAQSPTRSGDDGHKQHGDRHPMDRGATKDSTVNHGGHGQMDHGAMKHSGHGHADHDATGMAPDGIALAEGGEDRDGLEMDVLHVRLGPVLGHWPAGLVLRCSLQGDVLEEADAAMLDSHSRHDNPPPLQYRDGQALTAARQCDHAVDLLTLAGWAHAAAMARAARDALLSQPSVERGRPLLDTLYGKLRRSRVLRWSLRDIGALTVEDCDRLGLPVALAGDCYDRLLTRVDMARRVLCDPLRGKQFHVASGTVVNALPDLVRGRDVASARLVIASVGIDTAGEHAVGRDG